MCPCLEPFGFSITKQRELIKIINIYGEGGGVKVIVEVIAILFASRERATSIRQKRTGLAGADIASSSREQTRMI